MVEIARMEHSTSTLRCSVVSGEGIDKLAKNVSSLHKNIVL